MFRVDEVDVGCEVGEACEVDEVAQGCEVDEGCEAVEACKAGEADEVCEVDRPMHDRGAAVELGVRCGRGGAS